MSIRMTVESILLRVESRTDNPAGETWLRSSVSEEDRQDLLAVVQAVKSWLDSGAAPEIPLPQGQFLSIDDLNEITTALEMSDLDMIKVALEDLLRRLKAKEGNKKGRVEE